MVCACVYLLFICSFILVRNNQIDFAQHFKNDFALAQFVNHPSGGRAPNTICFPFDFTDSLFPTHLRAYIPNLNFISRLCDKPEQTDNVLVKGLALIALRDISDGEELLMDYHFSAKSEHLPSWYVQSDKGHSEQK